MLSHRCEFALRAEQDLRVSGQPSDADGAGGAGALPPAEAQEQHGDHGVGVGRPRRDRRHRRPGHLPAGAPLQL